MSAKPLPTPRSAYPHFTPIATRWADKDAYRHVNNVVCYAYFDTAVNKHLIDAGVLDVAASPVVGLVVETRCTYFSPAGCPDTVHVYVDRATNRSVPIPAPVREVLERVCG